MSDPTSDNTAAPDPALDALQVTLAAEHAAVFVYAALGAQTSQSTQPTRFAQLSRSYQIHRGRRDHLMALIDRSGADPVAAEPGYELPSSLGSESVVTARALELEEGAASTYAYLVANTTGEVRAWAVRALLDAAVRGLAFGGRPERLPGL